MRQHPCQSLLQVGKLRHREVKNMSKVIQLTKGKATFVFIDKRSALFF